MIVRDYKKPDANKPMSLYEMLGRMQAKREFIAQAYDFSEEYWTCQRELAVLERAFDEANKLWLDHQKQKRQ